MGGGDITSKINFYWLVGKFVFTKKNCCLNVVQKCSDFLSYYFGESNSFSYVNVLFMKKFYLYFPIYNKIFGKLTWDYYLELLKINNKKIAYFYFRVCVFCSLSLSDLKNMLSCDIYHRI